MERKKAINTCNMARINVCKQMEKRKGVEIQPLNKRQEKSKGNKEGRKK